MNFVIRFSGLFFYYYFVDKDAVSSIEIDLDVGDVCGAIISSRGDIFIVVTLWDIKKRMFIDMIRDMSMEMKRIW